MSRYIIKCRQCGEKNPEDAQFCKGCDAHIKGTEPEEDVAQSPGASPAQQADAEDRRAGENIGNADDRPQEQAPVTQRQGGEALLLYLVSWATGTQYPVYSGNLVGQKHATSPADVQIDPDREQGANYIHRSHCRFDCFEDTWFVTTIDHGNSGDNFTNDTLLNNKLIGRGERRSLQSDDQLVLAEVVFTVQVV